MIWLATALAVLVPLALCVGYWIGRIESAQYLSAATAVQSITNETVGRWNQTEAATQAALESLDRRAKAQGELIASTHRVLSELVLEQRDARNNLTPTLANARQVGEPAPWDMSR